MLNTLIRPALAMVAGVAVAMIPIAGATAGVIDPVDCERFPSAPACSIDVGTPGAPGGGGGSQAGGGQCHDLFGETVPCSVPGKGWYGGDGCWYQPAAGDDLGAAEALGGKATPPARWYAGSCGDPATNFWPAGLTRYRLFGGAGPNAAVLAQQAVRQLRLPPPGVRLSPAPPAPQLVSLPTWVWLDQASWHAQSATASVPGLSVTATATPSRLVLATGDGATVTCTGPGTAWTPRMDPQAASPSCGHTFTRAGTVTVTATVTWDIRWAGGGVTGTVAPLTTTANVTTGVAETGGINTAQAR